jgi:hypothetical protein
MSKKLMLLAAGALSALAFAALPTIASAGEYEVHCPTVPCVGNITGTNAEHAIELENDAGEKVDATAVDGTVTINAATTTTATAELEFTHVYETTSGFNFTCNSTGAPSGVIRTGAIPAHFVNLTHGGTNPGVLLTNINVTFSCAGGLVVKTVTGNIIGTITTPNCNGASATNVVTFNKKAGTPGTQEHEQVTNTGTFFDLTSGDHKNANDLTTSAQTGRGVITWDNKPTITC